MWGFGGLQWWEFGAWGAGFRVHGSGFMVQGSWFMVHGSWFMVHGSWFRVQDSGFRVQGSVFSVQCSGVQSSGFRVSGGRGPLGMSESGQMVRRGRLRRGGKVSALPAAGFCLTEVFIPGVFKKSIPPQIRQLILYYYQ